MTKPRLSKRFGSDAGFLTVGEVSIREIAERVPTPFYVYDAQTVRDGFRALRSAVPEPGRLFYSIKANPNVAVCSILQKLGAGAEIASYGELEAALKAGFGPGRIVFAGPGKSDLDLRMAVRAGIKSINVESLSELQHIDRISKRMGKTTPVCFRINLDFGTGVAPSRMVKMTGSDQKFGFDPDSFFRMVRNLTDLGHVSPKGFHIYFGTQIRDPNVFLTGIRIFFRWLKENLARIPFPIRILNLGGGFGIPIDSADKELDLTRLAVGLSGIFSKIKRTPGFEDVEFLFEPGRFLVGPSGIYVTRVIDRKVSGGKTFLVTDGGINHSLLPIAINRNYPVRLLNRFDGKPSRMYVVCGPLCLSLDSFSREVRLPEAKIGDLLGIFQSGAYGFTASLLYFLSHPLPAEVLVDKRKWGIVRKSVLPSLLLQGQKSFPK